MKAAQVKMQVEKRAESINMNFQRTILCY